MKAKTYLASRIEAVRFVLPEHLNNMGNMHGGEIMKLMDDTAGLTFCRHSSGIAVTVAANDIRFIKPIPANSIIKCITEVIGTGRTSMQVSAQIFMEDVQTGDVTLAAEGVFIGVAIDENGKPRVVPSVITDQTKKQIDNKEKEA